MTMKFIPCFPDPETQDFADFLAKVYSMLYLDPRVTYIALEDNEFLDDGSTWGPDNLVLFTGFDLPEFDAFLSDWNQDGEHLECVTIHGLRQFYHNKLVRVEWGGAS